MVQVFSSGNETIHSLTFHANLISNFYTTNDSNEDFYSKSSHKPIYNCLSIFTGCQRRWGEVMFSVMCVCHSVRGGPWTGPQPSSPQACSNLLDLNLIVQGHPLPQDMSQLVHYETRTVGKWAVAIWVSCFEDIAHRNVYTNHCHKYNMALNIAMILIMLLIFTFHSSNK